jgi:hypothetical protein
VRLNQVWNGTDIARRTARTCVQRLAKTCRCLHPASDPSQAIGFLAASLERWCR